MRHVQAHAHARAGLLGNPSDGYEGKAIAIAIANFRATVALEESDRIEIVPGPADGLAARDYGELTEHLREQGPYGGLRLIHAAMLRLSRHFEANGVRVGHDARFRLSYESDIPRQVGMSGSSAIVIATLRALLEWFGVGIEPHVLAEIALSAELEELGIAAGPMDRVIQCHQGAMLMDFKLPRGAASYRRLDPAMLPPLFVAYDPRIGEISGKVHSDVRARWLRGDPDVREAIAIFPRLVDEGIAALERGDRDEFMRLVNLNFDTRARIWTLSDRDHEMVRIGRERGAATKFCGSGGAVVGVLREESDDARVREGYEAAGYRYVRPEIAPGVG